MKENIKYFSTLAEANGYIINDIPFTSYIKEKGLVLFNNDPNKMIIILNNKAIVHEAVNIVFETLNVANGYIIENIPFSCYIKENQQLLECNLENCKIVVEGGVAIIKEINDIIRYTATSKVTPYKLSSLPTIISNDFDPNTGKGIIKFVTDVSSIGEGAFEYRASLTSVTIPNSVTSIGAEAFSWCTQLVSINIPNGVTRIENGAFAYCYGLPSVTIPNSVTTIENGTFYECTSLASVTIDNGVTSIGVSAFYNCSSLTSIEIPDSVINIGNRAFQYCKGLASVAIPNSVTNIGNRAFSGCISLTSVNIPNRTASIGEYTFSACTSLTSILIPNSITSIGDCAFYNCTGLTSISYTGTINQYNSITKGADWHVNVPATIVYCTDGDTPI